MYLAISAVSKDRETLLCRFQGSPRTQRNCHSLVIALGDLKPVNLVHNADVEISV